MTLRRSRKVIPAKVGDPATLILILSDFAKQK